MQTESIPAARAWAPLWALVAAIIAAVAGLLWLYSGTSTRFEEMALGLNTTSVYATYEGDFVHCSDLDGDPSPPVRPAAEACLEPAASRGLTSRVLWLGNSQLHGVNQAEDGQTSAPGVLAAALRPKGVEVLGFSQPNASLAEHYVLFEMLSRRFEPDVLVLPLVFDDTREGQIRTSVGRAVTDADVRAALTGTRTGGRILKKVDATLEPEEDTSAAASLQSLSEDAITALMESCCGWESLREQARGGIAGGLYQTRNTVFGIKPTTKRRKIVARYAQNLDAYRETLKSARDRGIKVFAYIAPLRDDFERPYVTSEYEAFKREVTEIGTELGAEVQDLEALVPNELWDRKFATGAVSKNLDFMHFQYPGHILLAEAIEHAVLEILE